MEFEKLTVAELEARRAEIGKLVDEEGADIDALDTEIRAIVAELERRENAEAKKAEIRSNIANGAGKVITNIQEERKMNIEDMTVEERNKLYRRAFLKDLCQRDGKFLLGEMTEEERSAFIFTTANSGNVVPEILQNKIIELVEAQAPMLADADLSNMTQGFGIPRHTGIDQGDATGVTEGTANDDEEDTFDQLPLDGIEIKKHVTISRKMKFKSIDAFEDWLAKHLADRIAVAKEAVIVARLNGSAPAGGSAVEAAAIAASNVLTGQSYTDAAIRGMFALLKGAGERVIYCNTKTAWTKLFGIVDEEGRKIFTANSMEDPIVAGRLYGAPVKINDALSDNVVYLGVKGSIAANDYDDIEIFSAVEPKTANQIETAYSLFDAGLKNPKSFVKATFTP